MPMAGVLGGVAIILFLALEFPRQKRFARYLTLILLGAGMLALGFVPAPLATGQEALRKAAGYAAFFLALGFLRDAAETSPLVRRCGLDLVEQPPGTRYAALTLGTHLFAVILSYGAIELMGAMLSRTLPAADRDGRKDAMTGVYRGFAATTAWSPLNIGMAVVLAAVPQVDWTELVPRGFLFALAVLALGALLRPRRPATGARPRIDWIAHGKLCGVVVLVFLAAFAVEEAFRVRLVVGVTAVLPVLSLLWIALQARGAAAARARAAGARLVTQVRHRVPTYRAEAAVLSARASRAPPWPRPSRPPPWRPCCNRPVSAAWSCCWPFRP
jgi:Na+-transporting methylmalonyl-CoA/oxaloacetate decarboxylase gamma subunit